MGDAPAMKAVEAPAMKATAMKVAKVPAAMKAVKVVKATKEKKLGIKTKFGKDQKVHFDEKNPKRPGSLSYARYEKYKSASTVSAARKLGAAVGDISHDA